MTRVAGRLALIASCNWRLPRAREGQANWMQLRRPGVLTTGRFDLIASLQLRSGAGLEREYRPRLRCGTGSFAAAHARPARSHATWPPAAAGFHASEGSNRLDAAAGSHRFYQVMPNNRGHMCGRWRGKAEGLRRCGRMGLLRWGGWAVDVGG